MKIIRHAMRQLITRFEVNVKNAVITVTIKNSTTKRIFRLCPLKIAFRIVTNPTYIAPGRKVYFVTSPSLPRKQIIIKITESAQKTSPI
jgi:hypothetical protein